MPRNHDWLVSNAGWDSTVLTVNPGTTLLVPLTSSNAQQMHLVDPVGLRPDAPETSSNMVVERVVGRIYAVYSDMAPATASEQQTDFVIEVLDADLDGVPLIPSDLNYNDAWSANRSFMWHTMIYAVNLTSWWTDRPGYGQFNVIDVDIRVKRRVENNEVLTLVVDNSFTIGTGDQRVSIINRLRTLVSWA